MRYIRLYLYFIRFAFSRAMEFRIDFTFRIIMDIVFYIIQFLFFSVLYLHTSEIGGWNIEQIKIFVSATIFVDALYMTVFANGAWRFPNHVNEGMLDYYLTKPVSTLFFISLKDFAANSFLNLVIASCILGHFLWNYPDELSAVKIFAFILLLLNGTIINYYIHLFFLTSTFWTQSPRGFADLFYTVAKAYEKPDGIFQGFIKRVFLYMLPLSLIASYPVRFLLEGEEIIVLSTIAGVTLILICIVTAIWHRGLRSYSSASS